MLHSYRNLLIWLIVGLLSACSNQNDPVADLILKNAKVYTLESDQPWAEAVAISNGNIVFVGKTSEALEWVGTNTQVEDLDGKMLLPGFIDTHMHPISGGAYAKALSLDTFSTVENWLQAISKYNEEHPGNDLLFGYGFLATTFGSEGPTRQMIDKVVSDRPVLIMDEGFHGAWANSKAMEKLNITQDTPDPVSGFSYYKRDKNGDATGYLLEGTAGLAMGRLNAITEEIIVDGSAFVIETLNAYGVTSVFDAGAIGDNQSLHSVLKQLEKNDDMTIRIVGSYRPEGPEDVDKAVANTLQYAKDIKGERYHYRTLKIMHDGTIEGRTAAMFEDYQGEPGNQGKTVYSQAEITKMVVEATENNLDVHIHALGERAIWESLNAIEIAQQSHGESDSRFTICHIQVIADEDLQRFADLGVIAQSTPLWASYDTFGKQFVSEDQFSRYFRFNSLHNLNVTLTFGSDFPATGAGMLGMSPIYQMEIGRTRQDASKENAPIQPTASERLDLGTLIRGYTIDAAYQLHMEDEIGSIKVGKKADLVILDKNLFEVELYNTHLIQVERTYLDGELVYQREK